MRGIVRSLSRPETASAPARDKSTQHRYGVMGLVFDSSQSFDVPREFVLVELGSEPERNPNRVFCTRASSPPEDSALPSQIAWSHEADAALAKL